MSEILSIETPALFEAAVRRACEILRAGRVVALPTETVYGLAANAFDPAAVEQIFRIKGRPSWNPVITHVASMEMARRCVREWPAAANALAAAFWPGPLTVVLPRSQAIPDCVTASGPTVGVRWPSHPFIQAVLRSCDFPLAAPSANLSTRVSPTTAYHVQQQLGERVPMIIDGGSCQVGIESTVVDLSVSPPQVLRPGAIGLAALGSVIGTVAPKSSVGEGKLKSPGLLEKHYAPRARLVVRSWETERELLRILNELKLAGPIHIVAHTRIFSVGESVTTHVIPHDPEAFARALYAQLHACDGDGAALILVEALPDTDEWAAVQDRLNRAAFKTQA